MLPMESAAYTCKRVVRAIEYIRATTAYGGDEYGRYSDGYSYLNRIAFEDWLAKQPKASGVTLFRGYCFEEHYWEDCFVQEGSVIGEDQMTAELDLPAFTLGPLRAVNYMGEFGGGVGNSGTKVFFEIRTTGKYFVDISEHSVYKEHEYRCVRGTRLLVESITQKGGYIHIKCTEI